MLTGLAFSRNPPKMTNFKQENVLLHQISAKFCMLLIFFRIQVMYTVSAYHTPKNEYVGFSSMRITTIYRFCHYKTTEHNRF